MRTIAIADESGTTGWFRDVEETIEEAVTWAENHGLHVMVASGVVYVRERIDTCDGCGTTTFIVLRQPIYDEAGAVDYVYQFCFMCASREDEKPEWVDNLNTEHFEGMMKEMNA